MQQPFGSLRYLVVFLMFILSGCSEHRVDTVAEWCEQLRGVDLNKKYAPFWAVIPSVSFKGDAIRDDYAQLLNSSYLEKVKGRAQRMAWREGNNLHLTNLSGFFDIEPEKIINEWRKGIQLDIQGKSKVEADACLYGTLTSMFDELHIHSMTPDAFGVKWKDSVTVISTDREKRIGKNKL